MRYSKFFRRAFPAIAVFVLIAGFSSCRHPTSTQGCTIAFDANGGIGTMAPLAARPGVDLTLTANSFTRESHRFIGWAASAGATSAEYADKSSYTMGQENVTLYAVWYAENPASDFTFTIAGGQVTIMGYIGSDPTVVIPERIAGYPVTALKTAASASAGAFYGNLTVTSVEIPSTLADLGAYAFSGCSNLATVLILSSPTVIGTGSFVDCIRLSSVTLPGSVTGIGASAFQSCDSLTSIDIPSGVTSLGESAFLACSGLLGVRIPALVTSIGDNAFRGCTSLASIYVDAAAPPALGTTLGATSAFLNIDATARIHVPSASVDTYKATPPWDTYISIIVSQ